MSIETKLQRIAKSCEHKEKKIQTEIISDELFLIDERFKRVGATSGTKAKNAEYLVKEKKSLKQQKELIQKLLNIL